MTDQIRDEKEFREFYQDYLEGQSDLSHLYISSETVTPSDKVDQAILNAAKKQTNKSQLVHFPTKKHTRYYSLVAGVALFSLVGILVFNTWEAEQRQLQEDFSAEKSLPSEADYIQPNMQIRMGRAAKPDSQEALHDMVKKEEAREIIHLEEQAIAPPPAPALMAPEPKAMRKMSTQGYAPSASQLKAKKPGVEIMSSPTIEMEASEWLLKIDDLIAKGQVEPAKNELLRFIQHYPDHPLAEKYLNLLADKKTVIGQ